MLLIIVLYSYLFIMAKTTIQYIKKIRKLCFYKGKSVLNSLFMICSFILLSLKIYWNDIFCIYHCFFFKDCLLDICLE